MGNTKHTRKRKHRIAISISDRDFELLKLYATSKSVTKGTAIKQLLHSELKQFKSTIGERPIQNQLNLFVAPQTNIFDAINEKK
ncbi:MAG: hypothetical protein IJP95_09245 [Bacteroidales bacterium]|nr:hypothetical protein [Bacteroidales bacterium]